MHLVSTALHNSILIKSSCVVYHELSAPAYIAFGTTDDVIKDVINDIKGIE